MKDVAKVIHSHLQGAVAWAQTKQTNGFLEAINGLFQAACARPHTYCNDQNGDLFGRPLKDDHVLHPCHHRP